MPGFIKAEVFSEPHLFENNTATLSVVQTADGLLHVGASRGLSTFDGQKWTEISIEGLHDVVGLATDRDGRIMVGTYETPGFLESQPDGRLKFVPLNALLPEGFAGRTLFFAPTPDRRGVYYVSFNSIFRWDRANRIEAWSTLDFFPYLVVLPDQVLISDGQRGLLRETDRGWEVIPGSEVTPALAESQAEKIMGAIPFRKGSLLLTEHDGFRFFDGQQVSRLELPGADLLRKSRQPLIGIRALARGWFVVWDEDINVLIFDENGRVALSWASNSVPGHTATGVFVDRAQNLWVTAPDGLMRVDYDSPSRVLDDRAGWPFVPVGVFQYGDKRIFGWEVQSYEWVQGDYPGSGIVRRTENEQIVLGAFGGDLMYTPRWNADVYCRYGDGRVEPVLQGDKWRLARSRGHENEVYAFKYPALLARLQKVDGKWIQAEPTQSMPTQFESIIEDSTHVWYVLGEGRVARSDLRPLGANFKVYGHESGLPDRWIQAFVVGSEVLFGTRVGIYRFDAPTERFAPDARFDSLPSSVSRDFHSLQTDGNGDIWIGADSGAGMLRREANGTFRWDPSALRAVRNLRVLRMDWDDAGWMWCRTTTALYAVRPTPDRTSLEPLQVHVGEVRDLATRAVLTGAYQPKNFAPPVWSYSQNSIEFELIAPEFVVPSGVEFQTWLDGRDETWSAWNHHSVGRFPGLSEGSYVLHYRARNSLGQVAEGPTFAFTIQPPIYRTWPACLGYLLGLMGVSWSAVRIYSRRLHRQNARLEALVHERTEDLEKAHRELVDASHRAGMAEVATSVLHNVGNTLNSVNVSASMIAEALHRPSPGRLDKLAALFSEHENDLAEFLSKDAKARQLTRFVREAARVSGEERDQMRGEALLLQKNIENINEIVAMQQAYAMAPTRCELLEPARLLEDALQIQRASLDDQRITVEQQFSAVPPIFGHADKLLRLLVTLLQNAQLACAETSRTDCRIVLRIGQATADKVQFVVEDNGGGIPQENLSRVFQQGFSSRKGGNGFALHVAATTATEMKGTLKVQSDGLMKGDTFTLELPVGAVAQKSRRSTHLNPQAISTQVTA